MSNHKTSSADKVDTYRRLIFLTMLLLSLIFAVKTGFYLVENEVKSILEIIAKGLFASFVIVLLAAIFVKWRYILPGERSVLSDTDSYSYQKMNEACKVSWILTLLLLAFITTMTTKLSSAFPTEFYLNLTLFFMMAVFSISFFILFQWQNEGESSNTDV
ncbi:hypothetical protein [Ekhidna sp.]|uniref:hypothetical protein n=1 Tax=Ekhidna sp. TaxID=2608089 RepID=UPI003298AC69